MRTVLVFEDFGTIGNSQYDEHATSAARTDRYLWGEIACLLVRQHQMQHGGRLAAVDLRLELLYGGKGSCQTWRGREM